MSRTPIKHPVSGAVTEFYVEEMRDGHGPRVFARRVNREVLQQGPNGMQNPVETFVVYYNANERNPLGGFQLPEIPMDARHSRSVTSGDGQSMYDLYANKPGWRFAREDDVIAMIKRGIAITEARAKQRAASTPEAASVRLASEVASAVATAMQSSRKGGSNVQA